MTLLNILSLLIGFSVVLLVVLSWSILVKALKTHNKGKVVAVLLIKYIVLIALVTMLVRFNLTDIYFFIGSFVCIVAAVIYFLLFSDSIAKKYEQNK